METQINPFSNVGELHNGGLDFYIQTVAKNVGNDELTFEIIVQHVCTYLKAINNGSKLAESIYAAEIISVYQKGRSNGQIIKGLGLEKMAEELLNELLGISSDDPDLCLQKASKLYERLISANFNERDRRILQYLFAIAEASIQYWKQENTKKKSLWNTFVGKVKSWPWQEDVRGGAKAMVSPTATMIFGGLPDPFLTSTIIIGSSILASTMSYRDKVRILKQEEQSKTNREIIEGRKASRRSGSLLK